jgi:hypothetical protein
MAPVSEVTPAEVMAKPTEVAAAEVTEVMASEAMTSEMAPAEVMATEMTATEVMAATEVTTTVAAAKMTAMGGRRHRHERSHPSDGGGEQDRRSNHFPLLCQRICSSQH